MGGGTAGWVSALYFLNKSEELNLNLNVKLISSEEIGTIGVGEGTTGVFTNFIENICRIDKAEFLRETKGSFKYGIKFCNWNFDNEYYYHLFTTSSPFEKEICDEDRLFYQYVINEDLNVPQQILQRRFFKSIYDIIENNKIDNNLIPSYSYHFSAGLVVEFFKKKCLEFSNFTYKDSIIKEIRYNKNNYIEKLILNSGEEVQADFFVNCLGFEGNSLLLDEYSDIKFYDNYLLNNSAFAIQVSNTPLENIDTYTTSTAQEYGWTWKIPQYEKTGYGYVYCDDFIDDENKLYDDIIKTYNVKEKNIFKTKKLKFKPFLNRKQIHKNCISLGLSSAFVEPLEATSIEMTINALSGLFDIIDFNNDKFLIDEGRISKYNRYNSKYWEKVFKFILFHYFTNNPINDYWKHYNNIQKNELFEYFETHGTSAFFPQSSWNSISFGLKIKDYSYNMSTENYLKENIYNYFKTESRIDCNSFLSHRKILDEVNGRNQKNMKYT